MIFDIVFLLDCTRSMDPYIEWVMKSLKGLIQQLYTVLNLKNQNTCNFGMIFFRDKIPEGKIKFFKEGKVLPQTEIIKLQPIDFNSNIEQNIFYKKLDSILQNKECDGGDDFCEDIKTPLQIALSNEMGWQAKPEQRIIFLITDAPCHGSEYHLPGFSDNFPYDDLNDEIEELINTGVNFVILKVSKYVDKMCQEFIQQFEQYKDQIQKVMQKLQIIDIEELKNQSDQGKDIIDKFISAIVEITDIKLISQQVKFTGATISIQQLLKDKKQFQFNTDQ